MPCGFLWRLVRRLQLTLPPRPDSWGHPFLSHTFLYHITRLDHRHNFSPYFYSFYLSTSPSLPSVPWSSLIRHPLAAFIPQLGLSVGLGFAFGKEDLAFAWLVQTMAFVTFNKVCTSQVRSFRPPPFLSAFADVCCRERQYFLWYLWFLPPSLPSLFISRPRSLALLAAWILAQALWLSQAYQLEMRAQPVYHRVWAAGILFFVVNCWVIVELIKGWRPPGMARGTEIEKEQQRVRWYRKKL